MTRYLLRSLVTPFFQENGGLIIFIYTMMVFIVNSQSGAGLYEYHLFLVLGTFKYPGMMAMVFLLWFLYTRKFTGFVVAEMHKPHNNFLSVFNYLGMGRQAGLFFIATFLLMIPVWGYVVFMVITGMQKGFYMGVGIIIGYLLLLCLGSALWLAFRLRHIAEGKIPVFKTLHYTTITGVLLRYVASKQLVTWIGLKLFTCGLVYLITVNNSIKYYDGPTVFLLISIGILGNGVIIFRCRDFEETYLSFYRTMPVGLFDRWLEYALLDLLLILPELVLLLVLAPENLPVKDGVIFSLCGYSSMLFLTSLTFYKHFTKQQFYKILLLIIAVQFVFLMTVGLTALFIVLIIAAIVLFRRKYYRFETLLP